MPRQTKNPKVILALSPAATATALGIRLERVAAAISSGALTVHALGLKRRILVREIEAWVSTWPVAVKRKTR